MSVNCPLGGLLAQRMACQHCQNNQFFLDVEIEKPEVWIQCSNCSHKIQLSDDLIQGLISFERGKGDGGIPGKSTT